MYFNKWSEFRFIQLVTVPLEEEEMVHSSHIRVNIRKTVDFTDVWNKVRIVDWFRAAKGSHEALDKGCFQKEAWKHSLTVAAAGNSSGIAWNGIHRPSSHSRYSAAMLLRVIPLHCTGLLQLVPSNYLFLSFPQQHCKYMKKNLLHADRGEI